LHFTPLRTSSALSAGPVTTVDSASGSVACISSAATVESQAAHQQPRAWEPVAKPFTFIHTGDPSLQTVVARKPSLREDKHSFRLESRSMTVRFRPVEANELVDDERAARLYMGSAITMEQGKLARSLTPYRCSCLQHAPPTSATNHRLPNPQPVPSAAGPESTAFIYRSFTASWPTAMLETALFCFSIGCPRTTLPTKHFPLDAV